MSVGERGKRRVRDPWHNHPTLAQTADRSVSNTPYFVMVCHVVELATQKTNGTDSKKIEKAT